MKRIIILREIVEIFFNTSKNYNVNRNVVISLVKRQKIHGDDNGNTKITNLYCLKFTNFGK